MLSQLSLLLWYIKLQGTTSTELDRLVLLNIIVSLLLEMIAQNIFCAQLFTSVKNTDIMELGDFYIDYLLNIYAEHAFIGLLQNK